MSSCGYIFSNLSTCVFINIISGVGACQMCIWFKIDSCQRCFVGVFVFWGFFLNHINKTSNVLIVPLIFLKTNFA